MLEDNFSVILVNDYAEIFRIMKNGCFRITADDDYVDQREAIQDARDNDPFIEGRIYVDIKEATNKVFNDRMYIGDEYIRRSHRITGETRFAWVNELGVVSELSDPIDIEGYRHVVVSKFPVVPLTDKKAINFDRIIKYNGEAGTHKTITEHTSSGWSDATLVNNKWVPVPTYTKKIKVTGFVLAVEKAGYYDDGLGNKTEIEEGVYLCLCVDLGAPIGVVPIRPTNTEYNMNVICLPCVDIAREYIIINDVIFYNAAVLDLNALTIPSISSVDTTDYVEPSLIEGEYQFDETKLTFENGVGLYEKAYIKLSNTYNKKVFDKPSTIRIFDSISGKYMVFTGQFFETKILLLTSDPQAGNCMEWDTGIIRAIEGASILSEDGWTFWQNIGYDCWEYLGWNKVVSISSIDLDTNLIYIDSVLDGSDIALSASEEKVWELMSLDSNRIALWNNSHIQGISQRLFHNGNSIVYEGAFQFESDNLNIRDDEINYSDYKIGYAPLMTLDYTGLRRIPMPMPMIRRAMRNPQHLTTAGGKVYAVEDNKIWVGSVDDFMMIDYIEIHSAVDHIASMDSGIVVSTRQGLYYVASGEGIKRIIGGEMIMSKFLAPCSGGVISVDGRDIHIIYKQVTDTGAWYPTVAKINNALTEINLEGEIKSVSIGKKIYIADDWNVWIYDMDEKVWAGKKHYKNRIHRLFSYKNKLGLAFETGVDRRNSFNDDGGGQA
jgi:hypothetical protein